MAEQPDLAGGPEHLLRVGPVTYDGRRVTASQAAGPWLAPPGRDTAAAGALGVLVDDVLGYAIVAARPAGHWSVSAEITLDVLEPLPTSGELWAEAEVLHVDRLGGYATGRVTDADGRVLAVGTQRGRFVPAPDVDLSPVPFDVPDGSEDAVAWLGRTYAVAEPFTVPGLMANPLGNVHGGMSFCLSDLVAAQAVGEHLTTASVHLTCTRAIPVGATLTYAAQVRHAGRTLAVVDVTGSLGDKPATVARVVLHPRT